MAATVDAAEQATGAYSVSQAMTLAQHALEGVAVRIVGEVSETSVKPGYKAAYFTIKDGSASLPCMMWNNRYRASGVQLAVGQLVEVTGRFTLYAAKGRMNFDVFSIALSGEGQLRLKVANLAKKLEAEGLTDARRKRPIPSMPERIGLVTSPRSAAVHDVLRTLRRRFPLATVLLAGVPVEGANAPAGIIEGIHAVTAAGAQVVLVVRGGGSFEDMMPFNDEGLARAIAACPVPVVTGIGHEVDTSVADMVSDLRASTPTAAAEAVSPAPEQLAAYFDGRADALFTYELRRLERLRARVQQVAARPLFAEPQRLFSNDALALDIASERLARALPARIEREGQALRALRARLLQVGSSLPVRFEHQMGLAAARLDDLSPVSVLARGYAIARDAQGHVVKNVAQVPAGADVCVSVSDGDLFCQVKETRPATRP